MGTSVRRVCVVLTFSASFAPAFAGHPVVLHKFTGSPDGSLPTSTLVQDKTGDFFGTTFNGGDIGCGGNGCGTVFKIARDGTETIIYSFHGGTDGEQPYGGLILDASGNLYGATTSGGGSGTGCRGYGCGTVFKITPDGTETVLYAFAGGSDGWFPGSTLVRDRAGVLYGATEYGGNSSKYCATDGCGTIFEITNDGAKSTLYAFCAQLACADGKYPIAGLVSDNSGNFFGTTYAGGSGYGAVFKLSADGVETVLHSFQSYNDGQFPYAGVTFDGAGNLYGTTTLGGAGNDYGGAVYVLAPDGTETLLHSFELGVDGANPQSGIIRDKAGNIYGTAYYCKGNGYKGAVFKLTPAGSERIACVPGPIVGGLIAFNGEVYGTGTSSKTNSNGLVFALKK